MPVGATRVEEPTWDTQSAPGTVCHQHCSHAHSCQAWLVIGVTQGASSEKGHTEKGRRGQRGPSGHLAHRTQVPHSLEQL